MFNVGEFVNEIVSTPEGEKPAKLAELCRLSCDRPTDMRILEAGMALTRLGTPMTAWAELAFAMALTIPHQRNYALYERGVLWSLNNHLPGAVSSFDELLATVGLSPQQMLYVARVNARAGNYIAAREILESAVSLDATLSIDAVAELQFYKYLERFPAREASDATERLHTTYEIIDHHAVARKIRAALTARMPFSVLRMGDGEGIHLKLSEQDEADFGTLYDQGRAQIHRIWYAGTRLVNDKAFIGEAARVQASFLNADCLGMLHGAQICHEYTIGSPRGIPAINNMIRFLEADTSAKPRFLCNTTVHRDLLLSGELGQILQDRDFAGIISCYEDLPRLLQMKYNIGEVVLYRTSGELVARRTIGLDNSSDDLAAVFMERHYEVCRSLMDVRPGSLYIVAGGFFGRLYADLIKRSGGIAIEVGSVADIWMNVGTRTFSTDEIALTLKRDDRGGN